MSKMKLNEVELRRLIKESVKQVLESKEKQILLEMVFSRKIYKEKVDDEIPQILTNWCLVRYCSYIEGGERLKPHWQVELRGHMFTAARYSLKKNDSYSTRQKVFNEIFGENDYYSIQHLNLTVCNKFIEENFDISSKNYEDVLIECVEHLGEIIDVILSKDASHIASYVSNL